MMTPGAWPAPERRRAPRYPLPLRVELAQALGHVRDISRSGLYVELVGRPEDAAYTLGRALHCTLVLDHADPRGRWRLRCYSTIVRLERRQDLLGIAGHFIAFQGDLVRA